MYPQQGRGMNHSAHMNPSPPSNAVPGIPGMPASAMVPAGGPSSGFALQHGYVAHIPLAQPSSSLLAVQPGQNKMWRQPQSFQQDGQNQAAQHPPPQKDQKHRDYLKQQQRLKAMPLSSSKGVTTDALIGNLLDKKDTFTLKQSGQPSGPMFQAASRSTVMSVNPHDSLPGWLIPTSPRLPPIYSHIWSLVTDSASGDTLVDTNKILALLLTSGLPKEVLGFIWNLATNGANVQLSQQQLYITLALVALAQMGCTFNNLSVLNFIPTPPVPSFNMNVPKAGADDKVKRCDAAALKPTEHFEPSNLLPPPSSSASSSSSVIPLPPTVATPPILNPSQNQQDGDNFGDEFTDFQSADPSYSLQSDHPNLCTSLPATAVIQPSMTAKQVVNELNLSVVSKLGRSQGRSIGSRLANHHLGAPKSNANQKPRRPSVESEFGGQEDLDSNYEKNLDPKDLSKHPRSCENEDFSDFQVAAGLDVNVDELFPKCHPKPKTQEFVLKESVIRSESDEEDVANRKEEELLAFDSPTSVKAPVSELNSIPPKLEMPIAARPPSKSGKELMTVEEDKYSALRWIEHETNSVLETNASRNEDADDFGDFVSADDMFAEIAVRKQGKSVQLPNELSASLPTPAVHTTEFAVDDWGTPEFQSSQPVPVLFDTNIVPSNPKSQYDDLSSAFSNLDVSKGSVDLLSKIDTSSKWNFLLDTGKESQSLNLDSNSNDSSSSNDEFGDFVGPDSSVIDVSNQKSLLAFPGDQSWIDSNSSKMVPDNKSVSSLELVGVTLSRHGSLPSLDLNLFPTSDDMGDKGAGSQVADWIRCLDSSCSLLQSAASTFTSIASHSILLEVLATTEGRNYLNNLLEVHRVTWRIQRSYQRSGHESNQVDSVLNSIQKVWSTLQTFYKLANIESAVEKGGCDEESGQPACGVCGSPASRGVLEYAGHVYHAPCANLWLNCVDRTFPAHSSLL